MAHAASPMGATVWLATRSIVASTAGELGVVAAGPADQVGEAPTRIGDRVGVPCRGALAGPLGTLWVVHRTLSMLNDISRRSSSDDARRLLSHDQPSGRLATQDSLSAA
jgi:hypothetical protein